MAEVSNISWTTATWNPWMGCHKVSAGCKNCYMFRDMARYGRDPNTVSRAVDSSFYNPIKWKKNGKLKPGSKIFTCSWSDWFIPEADEWRDQAWDIIKQTPEYTYLVLTKRIDLVPDRLPKGWDTGYNNVWLGITTEDNSNYRSRINLFHQIPAAKKFLSIEPLLSPMEINYSLIRCTECGERPVAHSPEKFSSKGASWRWNGNTWEHHHHHLMGHVECESDPLIDWVIIGGESDRNNARPMELNWARNIIAQCQNAKVPVFFKQTGSWLARELGLRSWKGDDPLEWPQFLNVQEFPS